MKSKNGEIISVITDIAGDVRSFHKHQEIKRVFNMPWREKEKICLFLLYLKENCTNFNNLPLAKLTLMDLVMKFIKDDYKGIWLSISSQNNNWMSIISFKVITSADRAHFNNAVIAYAVFVTLFQNSLQSLRYVSPQWWQTFVLWQRIWFFENGQKTNTISLGINSSGQKQDETMIVK